MEAAPNAMVMVDPEGKIVLVNSEAEKLFGYERRELLDRPIEILLPESSRSGHPGLRRAFFDRPQTRLMAAGREVHARKKDGEVFPVEIHLNVIEDAEGTWVLSSIVDVSEHRRALQRFRLAVEAAPNAMVLVNQEGRIVFVNAHAEKLFGYQGDELLGQAIEILVPESSRALHSHLRTGFSSHATRRQMAVGRDVHARRKDGTQFPVEIGLNPIESSEGVWVLTSIVDITFHRQKLESVGVLAGGIAHDFNNLLGSILADTELAMSELSDGTSPMEEIHNIRTVAIRAAEIVRELMTYAGREEANRDLVDVSWLVQEMLQLLKVSISKHALLKTDLRKDLPPVLGNAPQLRQVAMNLIINASEAIGEKGVISIATSHVRGGRDLAPNSAQELPQGDYLSLEVSDTGRGMSEEEVTRVFDPFFTTKFAGRGLGLAVVQGIVRAHGGAIHLVSSPGRGTKFQVFLPCATGRVHRDPIVAVPALEKRLPGPPRTVLLVEDEDALRLPVAKMLRKNGFAVREANDGSSAIEIFRSQRSHIDVILLDVTIPGATSLDVLEEVRRIRPDIKIILTSAYGPDMVPFPADAPRVTGFIRKPFQLSELLQLLREVLDGKAVIRAGG
jgi:hypothetical protein